MSGYGGRDLLGALKKGETTLHYQPIMRLDCEDIQVVGHEALLRWNHPRDGLLAAGRFLPALDHPHVAAAAGRWVMKSAPAQYFAARGRSQTLGLNVSPLELCGRGFCRQLEAASEVASDAGGNLILEVLEGHPIDPDDLLQLARVARKLDILLALDDYGVGFSTSEHRDLGVFDVVKIDRSFVPNTPRQMEEFARVAREIRAAKAVPLAEGIETAEEAEHVREAGGTLAQGYFFGRPGPLESLDEAMPEIAMADTRSDGPSARARASASEG